MSSRYFTGGSAGGGKILLGPPAPGGGLGGGPKVLDLPAPVKVVKVRAHTRTIPVKTPKAAAPSFIPGPGSAGGGSTPLGPSVTESTTYKPPPLVVSKPSSVALLPVTQSVRPGEGSDVKRFVPNFPKEPIAGYVQVRGGLPVRPPTTDPVTLAHLGIRPYYTNTNTLSKGAGPAGQESTQWNAATVAKAHTMQVANYGGKPGYVVRSLIPGGLDQSGTTSVTKAIIRGVEAGTAVLPGGGAREAAGVLGFGLKAITRLRAGKDVAEAVPKIADTAERTGAAATLAEKHGINVADVKGTGAGGKVLSGDVAAHHFQSLSPVAQAREGLKGARSQYGVEKAGRKTEQAAREQKAAEALATTKNPHEAIMASGAALRGKYPTIDYKGLKELTPDTLDQLMTDAQHHPALGFYGRRTVMVALKAAVEEGRVPRPAEQRLIEMVFGKKTAAGIAQQATRNWVDKVLNVANIPRALQTTADVSGLLRQNLVAMVSHPVLGARTLPVTFKAMRADGFEAAQQAVKDNPYYASAVQHGLQFTDIGEHTSMLGHEEGFQSDIAANALGKIPKVPNVIKGSARSYVALGNSMRMAAWENRMRIAERAGDESIHQEKTLRQIAQVINAATGRGTLPGRAEHLLPAMNTFMFSPRLMLARLHYLDPTWYFRLKGPARREALRGLFALSGSVTGALYLFSRIPGVKVNWNQPQNADWGKLKIGNTRIDIAGGFQQYVRLASELAPSFLGGGKTISSTTGKTTSLTSGKFGQPTRFDVVSNFIANKATPVAGAAIAGLRGHDPTGAPLTWGSLAQNYLTPLSFQDAKGIYDDKHGGMDGIMAALAGYVAGATGIGVQTYPPQAPKRSSGGGSGGYFGGSSSGGGSPYFSGSSSSGGSGYFGK